MDDPKPGKSADALKDVHRRTKSEQDHWYVSLMRAFFRDHWERVLFWLRIVLELVVVAALCLMCSS